MVFQKWFYRNIILQNELIIEIKYLNENLKLMLNLSHFMKWLDNFLTNFSVKKKTWGVLAILKPKKSVTLCFAGSYFLPLPVGGTTGGSGYCGSAVLAYRSSMLCRFWSADHSSNHAKHDGKMFHSSEVNGSTSRNNWKPLIIIKRKIIWESCVELFVVMYFVVSCVVKHIIPKSGLVI